MDFDFFIKKLNLIKLKSFYKLVFTFYSKGTSQIIIY